MPTIIPVAFNDDTQTPIIWKCSGCDVLFPLARMRPPTASELLKVNSEFRVHCQQEHPGETILGLVIPQKNEDESQAAAHIVKEATEDR